MPDDTTLQSVFAYAKQGPSGGENPTIPTVYVTYVAQFPNLHPPRPGVSDLDFADLVHYANGPMTLSHDKKTLSGEFRRWRNIFDPGLGDIGTPPSPPDAFDDPRKDFTIAISVSDSGQATLQLKLKGHPVGGSPPVPMNAIYENGLFVEKSTTGVKSLSFTLGTISG